MKLSPGDLIVDNYERRGIVLWREKIPDKKWLRLPFSIQVFLVRSAERERSYLLFHRNERPELGLPDFWQGISGALDPGESFAAAALREVAEETGISLGKD